MYDVREKTVDYCENCIEELKESFGERVICCDATRLSFEDDYFDFAIDRGASQHNTYNEMGRIYSEIRRVLNPGARFLSNILKEGDYGHFEVLTKLTEDDVRELFSVFSQIEVNYLTFTMAHATKKNVTYIIETVK